MKKQVTTRLDAPIAETLKSYCKMNSLIINSFIQECLLDSLEELLDIEDIKK
jgi:hypothetical protein